MDRQTLLAFLLIGFIIVLYPWYMSIVSPPELNMVPPSTQPKELINEKTTPEPIWPNWRTLFPDVKCFFIHPLLSVIIQVNHVAPIRNSICFRVLMAVWKHTLMHR